MGQKNIPGQFGMVIVCRKVRKNNEFQPVRTIPEEHLQRLVIREMTLLSPDTAFEMYGIGSLFQHPLIVVAFKKSGVTRRKPFGQMITYGPDVSKNPNSGTIRGLYRKAVRIHAVVLLPEWEHFQTAHTGGFAVHKPPGQGGIDRKPACMLGCTRYVHRQAVFPRQHLYTPRVVGMLMADKNRTNPGKIETSLVQPALRLTAGNTCIDQNGIPFVAHIVTIAVAAGVQGTDLESHRFTICQFSRHAPSCFAGSFLIFHLRCDQSHICGLAVIASSSMPAYRFRMVAGSAARLSSSITRYSSS